MNEWLRGCVAAVLVAGSLDAGTGWTPTTGGLLTRWAAEVDPDKPWPEYPRPQMVRPEWVNLNGLWDYALTDEAAEKPVAWDGHILVPFPIESSLSGVKKVLTPDQALWYRRAFSIPPMPEGHRLLLHVGAADWEATVWVNGHNVGMHRGGYDAFSFDVTDHLKPRTDQEVVVRVRDTTGANGSARGKQSVEAVAKPGGYWYTPCSGIWQTVWLEPVPATHIARLRVTPDLDAGQFHVVVDVTNATRDAVVQVVARDADGQEAGRVTGAAGESLSIALAAPRTWSPVDPHLYDLEVTCSAAGATIDEVRSYAGLRKVSLGSDDAGFARLLLNNEPLFQAGVLDQGYWPDGIYTPPTEEAMRSDLLQLKRLGFNLSRKHAKVESARWYYACDQLGVLVWQDMPSCSVAGKGSDAGDGEIVHPEGVPQFATELTAMVDGLNHFPSIIVWTVFNEGWGQHDTLALTARVKQQDPTRLVCSASGWHDRKVGDLRDVHEYPGPGAPSPEAKRAGVLGEFGGLALPVPGHQWVEKAWGYTKLESREALQEGIAGLWKGVHELAVTKGLSAAVYTQLTDVETECNGLMSYDRAVMKVDPEKLSAAMQRHE